MSKPWSGIGAWAAESEREEAEEQARAAASSVESQSFPSLKEAISAKPKKKKMTLSEFSGYASDLRQPSSRVSENKGLTTEEMLRLPTGPKPRSSDEMQSVRIGGGFPSYGRASGRYHDREDTEGSWGSSGRRSYGGFDEERRPPASRVSGFDQPSRADEVDNWAMSKKTLHTFESGRQSRYGSLGSGGGSRADEVDNWTAGKNNPLPSRSSGKREGPRLVLDPPKGASGTNDFLGVKANKSNPFGAARPREEVLAEKGLDWKKLDSEIEAKKTSRPTSAHSSRPSSVQSNRSEGLGLQGIENVMKPKPKVNPFGDAKPREVLLEERGKDWRKIDFELEHRGIDRPETQEEKKLKEKIDQLKKELEEESTSGGEPAQESSEQVSLHDTILEKERELEKLIGDLDDKVRFGQKETERPGSGAGRGGSFLDRPPSASFGESRNPEFVDRPRSRGIVDQWSRPVDDRRGFQSGGERRFLGSRDLDRSISRERW